MSKYEAGLDGVTFPSNGCKLLGGFYRAAGDTPRPTVVLLHGTPGIEKHLDIAYRLRDLGFNCLYFHFRGSWGSEGSFSFAHLADDTRAALDWVRRHPVVDSERIALVGGAMGGHAALLVAATDARVRAVVAMCPLIDPGAFELPEAMAHEFSTLLNGVTPRELLDQWQRVRSLHEVVDALAGRPILLVTADGDELFPPSHYSDFAARLPNGHWARAERTDHAFSMARPWLVHTVTDWLRTRSGLLPSREA
ncbi:alpha/beta fold hydrolase [Pendulispora brunnea]|uniref:Alpha/beta fold hydrolase n=1 Tax=Pendulispora brunnea TaxID=2905690 RepID=A0ABZ2KE68_9BACT